MGKYLSYSTSYSSAFSMLHLGYRQRPEEIFPRFEKQSFDDLKKSYTDQYGYIIKIPSLEDVIHLTPNLLKTESEIKAEKKEGLMNILASPSPGFARTYSSIMTYMDNIQDATSIVYPAFSMLWRLAPKVFGKILPIFGWMMLGTDLLNWIIALGRLPFSPMGGKRALCHETYNTSFSKTAQYLRKERLKNIKPTIADLLQVAQVTDQFTGVGLNLGPIMGAVMDSFFGAYHYLKGDPVRIAYDVPDMFEEEKLATRGIAAAGIINSAGQTFSDETHFWSLVVGAASARIFAPVAHDFDIMGSVEDPMNVMVPAAIPTDPLTIAVIQEQGLNVEDGVGWPYNEEKEISVGDLWDSLMPLNKDVFRDYSFRHSKDWYGYIVDTLWDQVVPSMIFAADPSGSVEYNDTPEMKAIFKMIKAPILPTGDIPEAQQEAFMSWLTQYHELYDEIPTTRDIKEKLTSLGISFKTSFPAEREPEADEVWPSDFPTADYNY